MKNVIDIIESLDSYLANLSKNKKVNFYFEDSKNDENNIVAEKNINYNKEKTKAVKEKKDIIEYDLFGNILQRTEKWELSTDLDELYSEIHECQKCPLGQLRTNFVFGEGDKNADVMFIGEAPGKQEDLEGRPFVGRAGQLLNNIIEATGFNREQVYIANVLKSRPPGNRTPLQEEVNVCRPYLDHQIKLIKPKFIIALGRVAAECLLNSKKTLTELRGRVHDYHGVKVIVTFHPAALLRNPAWKRPTWKDMQFFKKLYDEAI